MPNFSFPANATTTATRGRVIASSRQHHVVVDEPEFLGGPGEAPGAHEYFLMSVVGCATALIESFAHHEGFGLDGVTAEVEGTIDPAAAPRSDVNMFSRLVLRLTLEGIADDQARQLISLYEQRCPIYGTVAAALPVDVDWVAKPV